MRLWSIYIVLQSFKGLEIKLRYPLLHQFLHKLGQLPHLLDLIIDTDDSDLAPSIQPHSTPISISNSKFRQLRHLPVQILGTTAPIHCILDELKGLANLSTLKIDRESDTALWGFQVEDQDISVTWKSFFEVISTFSAVEDIEKFNRSRESISASSLAPLFRLDNLKGFVINDSIILSGSDDDFRLLAGGFPTLKKFVIPRPLSSDRRTLACLYYLYRDCPDLRGVAITLLSKISENLNAIKELPHPIVRNHHPLEKLYIDSDFGQLQPIQLVLARFLDLIFPTLSTLETDKSKSTEAANWAGIHELRSALREARMNPSSVGNI